MLHERLFSSPSLQPHESFRFVIAGSAEEPLSPAFTVPDDWSLEAAQSFQAAVCQIVPASRRAIEENTTPSWLWQHSAKGAETTHETSAMDVFERIAGAATYRGWKAGFWADENTASIFYDEVRAALVTRRLVIAPQAMATLGLDWAYGIPAAAAASKAPRAPHAKTLVLQNDTVDTILRRTQPLAHEKWESFFQNSLGHRTTTIAFADTIAQWGVLSTPSTAPSATINLLALRKEDGSIDIAGVRQATKLAVLLGEIFYADMTTRVTEERPLSLQLGNLAALLMSLSLPYDSDVARGTASALAAIVTATAAATSARLAEKNGACPAFNANREASLRALRNRLRATFDEKNDYDRLSILPQTLKIDSGVDLILIANARYASEEALHLVQKHGLRHLHLTGAMTDTSDLAPLLDSVASGVLAEQALCCDYAVGGDMFERRARPTLPLALDKLGYAPEDKAAIVDHVVGYKTLKAAPAVNHAILREKGFTDAPLARLEAVLPFVDHLRFAFTPWVLGAAFCRSVLKLSEVEVNDPAFNLLHKLGFSTQDVRTANNFCCGHRSVKGVLEIAPDHIAIFETAKDTAHEASLHMAAAVQSFVTDEVALSLPVPSSFNAPARAALVLRAWELGIKSLTLTMLSPFGKEHQAQAISAQTDLSSIKRKTPSLKTKTSMSRKKVAVLQSAPSLRGTKSRASAQTVSMKRGGSASAGKRTLRSK
ncbi:MAG TPA: hypothetical protein DCY07_06630 [Rhodospirillaceae bacterium]|nr:hypothetical protein [Rhodospirillaceae bacterium]